jgi:hypothetical protein
VCIAAARKCSNYDRVWQKKKRFPPFFLFGASGTSCPAHPPGERKRRKRNGGGPESGVEELLVTLGGVPPDRQVDGHHLSTSSTCLSFGLNKHISHRVCSFSSG